MILDQTYDFQGQRIAWGCKGAGEPIVLIHGTPFSSLVWRKIVPWLARKRKVYFFDLLGYGKSEMREGQDVSLGVQNHILAALLNHWALERPEIAAHDFGGATALRCHYINGVEYSALTLIDPVALAPWGSPFVQHVRKHEAAFAGLPAYAHAGLLKAYLQGAAHVPLSEEALETYMYPWTGAAGQPAFYRQIAQMDQRYTDEIEARYAKPRFPVQILWGEEDAWIPVERGEMLAALFRCNLVKVPGSGHLVQDDCPEAIVAALLADWR